MPASDELHERAGERGRPPRRDWRCGSGGQPARCSPRGLRRSRLPLRHCVDGRQLPGLRCYRRSSNWEEIRGLDLAPARSMRATAPERLLAATVTRSASTFATSEPGGGVAPAFLPKRNSGAIRARGPTGDDAARRRGAGAGLSAGGLLAAARRTGLATCRRIRLSMGTRSGGLVHASACWTRSSGSCSWRLAASARGPVRSAVVVHGVGIRAPRCR